MRDWCIGARSQFGATWGDAMYALGRKLTGHDCPCTYGEPCPLLPAPSEDTAHHWEHAVAGMDSNTPESIRLRILG